MYTAEDMAVDEGFLYLTSKVGDPSFTNEEFRTHWNALCERAGYPESIMRES